MPSTADLHALSPDQLRELAAQLLSTVQAQDEVIQSTHKVIAQRDQAIVQLDQTIAQRDKAITRYKVREEQLAHELALLKRHRFGKRSEGLNTLQLALLDSLVDEDLAAIETELEKLSDKTPEKRARQQPKRQALPKDLPRTEFCHEPESTTCSCGCALTRIGEDVSEKLDYQPGTFTVERHIRGKWSCRSCESLIQAPLAPHIIDKGLPTTGLLAQVLINKYADHLPLYRQEQQFSRAGVSIPRSTLADWVGRCGVELQPLVDALRKTLHQESVLHADETPVAMLAPGKKRTHKAYIWAYASTRFAQTQGVVYDFHPSRAGQAVRDFLDGWEGKLVCDDYSGYKASFTDHVIEIGCWAHYLESRFIWGSRPGTEAYCQVDAFAGWRLHNRTRHNIRSMNGDRRLGGERCRSRYGRHRVRRHTSQTESGVPPVFTPVRYIRRAAARLPVTAVILGRRPGACV